MLSLADLNNGFGFDISYTNEMKDSQDKKILEAMNSCQHIKEKLNEKLLGYSA